jgi:hypothetical protein
VHSLRQAQILSSVGRVLICEPHDDIAALLELVVRRLGHEAVFWTGDESRLAVDAAVIEPGEGAGMRLATQLAVRGVPVVFTSIFPADEATLRLRPAAYLVKPFPLFTLERALAGILGSPAAAAASG